MGSIGTTVSNKYPEFPQKTRYAKYEDTWYFEDATKEKFSREAYTGFTIKRFYYGGYHGRGTGSITSAYTVNYNNENLVESTLPGKRAFGTLKEAKEFLEGQKWRR